MIKLEMVDTYPLEGVRRWIKQVAITRNGWMAFLFSKEYPLQSIVFIKEGKIAYRDIQPENNSSVGSNDIVLFAYQDKICLLKNMYELEIITDPTQPSSFIPIKNGNFLKKVIPDTDPYKPAELRCLDIISDGPVFPIGFEWNLYEGEVGHIGYLELDLTKGTAKWIDFMGITENELFPERRNELVKYDSGMIKEKDVYFFCPGAKQTNVNKWGMDWYALLKTDRKGRIKEKIIDSGMLHLIDQKKRGVHGVFSYSKQYAILTPHFSSDEWKGKQKLFDLATREFIDIQMPRGLTKGIIIQHTGNEFWVSSHNEDNLYLAVCREVKEKG